MRQIRTSGSMSGDGKRSTGKPDRGVDIERADTRHRKPDATAPILDSTARDERSVEVGCTALETLVMNQTQAPQIGPGMSGSPAGLVEAWTSSVHGLQGDA